jgi:hypothetical protein
MLRNISPWETRGGTIEGPQPDATKDFLTELFYNSIMRIVAVALVALAALDYFFLHGAYMSAAADFGASVWHGLSGR